MPKTTAFICLLGLCSLTFEAQADDAGGGEIWQIQAQQISSEFKSCYASLLSRSVNFIIEKPFRNNTGCGVSNPVRLRAIKAGDTTIVLSGQPVLDCGFALRLTTWVSDIAAPVVAGFTNNTLVLISTGPGYVCRTRNNKKGAKISEHGFGNAIDITSFQTADRHNLTVTTRVNDPSNKGRLLSALRLSACGYFTTVLGPGSNNAHKSHFHFDHGKHGRTWNYRICE